MAGVGPGDAAGVTGSRLPEGELPRARRDSDPGAVGPTRGGPHPRLRPDRRLADHAELQDGGGRADAHRLAHGGGDRGPGVSRHRRGAWTAWLGSAASGSTRSPTSALPDRGGRPRQRGPGVGAPGAGRSNPAAVLRRPGRGAGRPDHPRQRRRRRLDRHGGRRTLAPTPCGAPTPSTSWPGPPRRWTRSAARLGTRPAQRWTAGAGRASGHARTLKRARSALWKNPENLTDHQRDKLAWIARTDPRLHRAYLLKEGLREPHRV